MVKKILSVLVIICFFLTSLGPLPLAHADTVLDLPQPGTMINLSPAYEPVMIKGLTVHKDNPFLFDFIVDVGEDNMSGEPLKKEGEKLIKYFLASLAIPDKDVWVNLSPYEKNKMIPEALGQTDMGRDLLEQDYILKQITASLIYPEKKLGKIFWDKVYAQARQKYGSSQIPVNAFNKVWIMADRAQVFEHNQTAFVVDCHLKVMLEEDYLALTKHQKFLTTINPIHSVASNIVRQIILPELEQEVNGGRNFAHLRQIVNSLILANWYKNNLKEALLNQVYANKAKVKGIDLNDQAFREQIYEQYLKAYKKGVFNYIKEDVNGAGPMIPRKYFSGGFIAGQAGHPAMTTNVAPLADHLPAHLVSMATGFIGHPLLAKAGDSWETAALLALLVAVVFVIKKLDSSYTFKGPGYGLDGQGNKIKVKYFHNRTLQGLGKFIAQEYGTEDFHKIGNTGEFDEAKGVTVKAEFDKITGQAKTIEVYPGDQVYAFKEEARRKINSAMISPVIAAASNDPNEINRVLGLIRSSNKYSPDAITIVGEYLEAKRNSLSAVEALESLGYESQAARYFLHAAWVAAAYHINGAGLELLIADNMKVEPHFNNGGLRSADRNIDQDTAETIAGTLKDLFNIYNIEKNIQDLEGQRETSDPQHLLTIAQTIKNKQQELEMSLWELPSLPKMGATPMKGALSENINAQLFEAIINEINMLAIAYHMDDRQKWDNPQNPYAGLEHFIRFGGDLETLSNRFIFNFKGEAYNSKAVLLSFWFYAYIRSHFVSKSFSEGMLQRRGMTPKEFIQEMQEQVAQWLNHYTLYEGERLGDDWGRVVVDSSVTNGLAVWLGDIFHGQFYDFNGSLPFSYITSVETNKDELKADELANTLAARANPDIAKRFSRILKYLLRKRSYLEHNIRAGDLKADAKQKVLQEITAVEKKMVLLTRSFTANAAMLLPTSDPGPFWFLGDSLISEQRRGDLYHLVTSMVYRQSTSGTMRQWLALVDRIEKFSGKEMKDISGSEIRGILNSLVEKKKLGFIKRIYGWSYYILPEIRDDEKKDKISGEYIYSNQYPLFTREKLESLPQEEEKWMVWDAREPVVVEYGKAEEILNKLSQAGKLRRSGTGILLAHILSAVENDNETYLVGRDKEDMAKLGLDLKDPDVRSIVKIHLRKEKRETRWAWAVFDEKRAEILTRKQVQKALGNAAMENKELLAQIASETELIEVLNFARLQPVVSEDILRKILTTSDDLRLLGHRGDITDYNEATRTAIMDRAYQLAFDSNRKSYTDNKEKIVGRFKEMFIDNRDEVFRQYLLATSKVTVNLQLLRKAVVENQEGIFRILRLKFDSLMQEYGVKTCFLALSNREFAFILAQIWNEVKLPDDNAVDAQGFSMRFKDITPAMKPGLMEQAFDTNHQPSGSLLPQKVNSAMMPGGIDLNTSNGMRWKIAKDGRGVEMDVDPAMIARVRSEGIGSLSAVIFRITPITNIWPLLGLPGPNRG